MIGQARPFSGVTIRGACFQHHFQTGITELLPEFEKLTGIKVNLELQSFPIYNQRMDLELSTQGSSYDFCNVTFPYSGRWIGSGWIHPLDEFLKDANATPPDWNPDDFVEGAQTAFRDAQGPHLRLRLGRWCNDDGHCAHGYPREGWPQGSSDDR